MQLLVNMEELVKYSRCHPARSRRSWGRDIKKLYKNQCVITGQVLPHDHLDSHHLDSVTLAPEKELCLLNGIPMSREQHKQFHHFYGKNPSIDQFIHYINLLKKTSDFNRRSYLNSVLYHLNNLQKEIQSKNSLERLRVSRLWP